MSITKPKFWLIFVGIILFLTACGIVQPASSLSPSSTVLPTITQMPVSEAVQQAPRPTIPPAATNVRVGSDGNIDRNYVIPRALIPQDGIRPIYEPVFAPPGEVTLSDEELVMGVSIGGEAKAYPIAVLRSREMVNDELAGLPILVTW